jgi:2-oxoglutarate dehydrogenase E2 component (dihydrolipoamide succinyltransferase)
VDTSVTKDEVTRNASTAKEIKGEENKPSSLPLAEIPAKKPIEETDQIKISPVARKMMEENNLRLEDILSGITRITSQHVKQVVDNPKGASPANPQISSSERSEDRKKMTPLRKKLSQRLVAVKNETAMLTTFNEVDMSRVMALRQQFQKKFVDHHGIKLGFMSFFTRAAAIALQLNPNVNAMIDGEEIVYHHYSDIGIAVQTPKGLMVPVIRNTHQLSLDEIEKEIAVLAEKARSGRIGLDDLSGGTFTITNGGVFGSLLSTPIINPPQSGILGMHNILERPVAINGKVEIRPMMYIALSYDHRVIDGKDSVGFLVKVKEMIEHPEKMLFNGADPAEVLLRLA